MYTLDDYRSAKNSVKHWSDKIANDTSNNPNKHQSSLRSAAHNLRLIESELKRIGILTRSEQEELECQLDLAFPYAKSNEIVTFNGKRYIRSFIPLQKSNSGKMVTEWGKSWNEMPNDKDA